MTDQRTDIRTIKIEQFHAMLRAQGVPKEHIAFKCPLCETIQSATDLIRVGAGKTFDDVEKYLGFSCVGRWTKAGPALKGTPPGRGCDWTLGGLLKMHKLEVETENGQHHPRFEPCTSEEAREHMR